MKQYQDLLQKIIEDGTDKGDRTGTGTRSIFGYQMRFDLEEGFPLLTTKKVPFRLVAEELMWFLRGETNINSLVEKNVHIWDEWADENGDLGPVYGSQWRSWPVYNMQPIRRRYEIPSYHSDSMDQIANVVTSIRDNPNSRRHIVTAWNPAEVESMALPPCHVLFQFYVADGKLSCHLYQRSSDVFLGVPFNIASYALLTHMVAHVTGLGVGEFIWSSGDTHLYNNHFEQAKLQLSRVPKDLPTLHITERGQNIDEFVIEDFIIEGYDPYPAIKADVSV